MTVLRSGVSTFVLSSKPATEFKSPAKVRSLSGTIAARGYLQLNLPADLAGANVYSAKLRLQNVGVWSGAVQLTVQRVATRWKLSTLNWNNRPGVTAGASVNVSKTSAAANTVWEFDVAADVQAWAAGAPNYGWRLLTTATATRYWWGFAAAKYKPTLEIDYGHGPATPTSLHPSAGAVSVAKPTLRFDAGEIVALRVQVDPAANGVTPGFDSGWEDSTAGQYDLALSAYAGLSNAASTQWRVQVKDASGTESAWSQWVTFSRVDKPALTISQPTGTVNEASPPIVFSMSGLVAFRVLIAKDNDPTRILYDSGKVPSTTGAHTPSSVITEDGATYRVTVQAWDAVLRENTPGDPGYVEASVATTLAFSATVAGVAWLGADQASPAPWVDLTWSRAIQPDGWVVVRDDVVIHVEDAANDLLISGSTYGWRDWTATPNREHTYRVAPVVNGVTSSAGPIDVLTPAGNGLWLADPDTGTDVVLWGNDAGTWAHGGDATVFNPIGADASVRVTTSLRGLEGTLAGILLDTFMAEDYPVAVCESVLWGFKGQPDLELRLVAGDINIPVNVFDLSLFPDPQTDQNQRIVNVSFGFSQTGELPFKADL